MKSSIKCIPFPNIPGAYVVISCNEDPEKGNGVKKCMSFFFDNGDVGAEWEPEYGPITKIIKLDKDDENAEPHWFYDYYAGQGFWSQMAVKEECLDVAFLSGNYEGLFRTLKYWAVND